MFKKIDALFLALILLCWGSLSANCKEMLDYIFENLPEYGTLAQDERGFVYVDLPNDYIHKLYPMIDEEGFEEPPYFVRPRMYGAHISVIYASEAKEHRIKVEEVGKTIYFSPKTCKIVKPGKWNEVEEVYIITVDAPALNKLRKRYGLKDATYPYHITVGVKYAEEQQDVGKAS